MTDLKAPFPYFGGKRRVADEVWRRFGNPKRYIEPFCGSAAVLLQRPGGKPENGDELINDLDGFVTNFYRTVKQRPEELTEKMDYTISELDLHARRDWLQEIEGDLIESLRSDSEYCHLKAAAWWCWGVCCWIGRNFPERDSNQLPYISSMGGRGIFNVYIDTSRLIRALSERLERTKICCGSWDRVVRSNSVLKHNRTEDAYTTIFLDPPYPNDSGSSKVYQNDSDSVAYEVEKWCREHEDDPTLMIALCGYEGTYDLPGWEKLRWKAQGGYSKIGDKQENRHRECIWFSPHCKDVGQESLLKEG